MPWNHQSTLAVCHYDMPALASDPITELLKHADRIPLIYSGQPGHLHHHFFKFSPFSLGLGSCVLLGHLQPQTNRRECTPSLLAEFVPGSSSLEGPDTQSRTLDRRESE